MDCRECREKLTEYLDDELSAGEAEAVEEHTSGCERCRREMEELRRTVEAVRDLPRHRVPGGMADEVTEEVRSTDGGARVLKLWMPAGVAAAAAVLVAMFVLPHVMNGVPPGEGVKRAPRPTRELQDRREPRPGTDRTATSEEAMGSGELSQEREESVLVLRARNPAALRGRIQEALRDRVVESRMDGDAEDDGRREVVLRVPKGQKGALVRRLRRMAEPEKLEKKEEDQAEAAETPSTTSLKQTRSAPGKKEGASQGREGGEASARCQFDATSEGPGEKDMSQQPEDVTYIRVRILGVESGSETEEN